MNIYRLVFKVSFKDSTRFIGTDGIYSHSAPFVIKDEEFSEFVSSACDLKYLYCIEKYVDGNWVVV